MIRVGVVGYGFWGPNLVRNFFESPATQVVAVADMNRDRLTAVQRTYPGIQVAEDYRNLLTNPDIDAIAISTPVCSHFAIGMEALKAGKHVLLEKPITATSEEALRLIEEADRRKLTLMVDHTFVYTGAVRKVRELIDKGLLGEIYYYDSTRINLGLFRHDVDVIWDLAVHDLSIMDYLVPQSPVAISATGIRHLANWTENVAYVTAFYDSPLIAHLNVNWLSPIKVRRTLIGGSRQMVLYDDMETNEKVKMYDKGITVTNRSEALYNMLVGYRMGDVYCPQLDVTEALRVEAEHFADCIENGKTPLTDGFAGLRVVQIMEAATESMKNRGRSVMLDNYASARAVCA